MKGESTAIDTAEEDAPPGVLIHLDGRHVTENRTSAESDYHFFGAPVMIRNDNVTRRWHLNRFESCVCWIQTALRELVRLCAP